MALRNQNGPSSLVLTRQTVPELPRPDDFDHKKVLKGAYVISIEKNSPAQAAILASGSEVANSIEAKEMLEEQGYSVRVVSIPCKDIFDQQSDKYKREILPESLKALIVVEAGTGGGWTTYFDLPLLPITIEKFGASAPYKVLEDKYGFTAEQMTEKIVKYMSEKGIG
jgi:transketolase